MGVYKNDTLIEQSIYGSSRLGLMTSASKAGYRTLGGKKYELSNHLGNVLAVVTDNIHLDQDSTWANVINTTDYYPFGLAMDGRTEQDSAYRYGFNGKEKDSSGEWGSNSHYDFGARIYDPRLGRFLSVDPLADAPEQIDKSPYAAMWNNPIKWNDPDGRCPSCWFSLQAAYQVAKTKYASIISQANAPAQRLISRTSGNTPSNIGMNAEMRSSIMITGLSSDLNAVADVGVKLTQETMMDVGDGLDKGGEAISIGGLASTPFTGPLGLTIMKVGDGVSAVGSSTKGIGYTIGGDYNSAGAEFAKAGVSAVTGKAVGKAIDYSKAVGNAPKGDFVQESILQTIDKGVNKISSYIVDFFKEEKKK